MRRSWKVLIAAVALQVLAACATVAGTAIGAGVGATQGHPVAGAAIGFGVGAAIDTLH